MQSSLYTSLLYIPHGFLFRISQNPSCDIPVPTDSVPACLFSLNFLCWLLLASAPCSTSLSPLTHLSLTKLHLGFTQHAFLAAGLFLRCNNLSILPGELIPQPSAYGSFLQKLLYWLPLRVTGPYHIITFFLFILFIMIIYLFVRMRNFAL